MARLMLLHLGEVRVDLGESAMGQPVAKLDAQSSLEEVGQVMTLLDLVSSIAASAETDAEVVAAVTDLINSGKIRLIGNFRGADVRVG